MYSIYEKKIYNSSFTSFNYFSITWDINGNPNDYSIIEYNAGKLIENPTIVFPKDNTQIMNTLNEKLGFMLLLDLINEKYFDDEDTKTVEGCRKIVENINNRKGKFWNGNSLSARTIKILENNYNINIKLDFDENTYSEVENEFFCISRNYLFYYESGIDKMMFYNTINRKTKKKKIPQDDNDLMNVLYPILFNGSVVIRDFDGAVDKGILANTKKQNIYFNLYSDLSKDKDNNHSDYLLGSVQEKLTIDGETIPINLLDYRDKTIYKTPIEKFSLYVAETINNTPLRFSSIEKLFEPDSRNYSRSTIPSIGNYRFDEYVRDRLDGKIKFDINLNKKDLLHPFGYPMNGMCDQFYYIFANDELINYKVRSNDLKRFWTLIMDDSIIFTFESISEISLNEITGE